jgi:hypothetical protein
MELGVAEKWNYKNRIEFLISGCRANRIAVVVTGSIVHRT